MNFTYILHSSSVKNAGKNPDGNAYPQTSILLSFTAKQNFVSKTQNPHSLSSGKGERRWGFLHARFLSDVQLAAIVQIQGGRLLTGDCSHTSVQKPSYLLLILGLFLSGSIPHQQEEPGNCSPSADGMRCRY